MDWFNILKKINDFFNNPNVIIFLLVFGIVEAAHFISKGDAGQAMIDIVCSIYWAYKLKEKM